MPPPRYAKGSPSQRKIGDEALIPRFLNTLGWLHAECEDHAAALARSDSSRV